MMVEDRSNNVDARLLVIVNGNVAETNHGLHACRCLGIDHAFLFQQAEGLAAFLRQTEAMNAHQVHGEIDGRLACTLKIQDD